MRWILVLLLIAAVVGLVSFLLRRSRPSERSGHVTPEKAPPSRPGLSPVQEIQAAPPDMVEPASYDPTAEARRAMSGPRPSANGGSRAPPTPEEERRIEDEPPRRR